MAEVPRAMLTIKGLAKNFDGLMAVKEVSLEVAEGEIRGLIGPNGAGKTTLLNMVMGLMPVSSGSLTFQGREITGTASHLRVGLGMAMTFQTPQLFPEMTVLENVLMGHHPRDRRGVATGLVNSRRYRLERDRVKERGEGVLALVGLKGEGEPLASALPYGKQKLLEIGRALMADPCLVLLDEPSAGMSPQEAASLMELVRGLNSRGVTVLLVEHNMRVVMALSHRVSVLNFGEKIAEGSPEEVQRDPRVIEAYLGT